MEIITDKEKLALLGFDDPAHSMSWYKSNVPNLPEILEIFITESVQKFGAFPKESKNEENRRKYHKYYLLIESIDQKYVVKINNTDRAELLKEHVFTELKEAARFLIRKSFTCGGSISQYYLI